MPRKRNYKKPGPITALTDELFKKIKECILKGNNLKQTANDCEIDEQKLYNWHYDNYLNIRDKIELWKTERKLKLANDNLEEILAMGTLNSKENDDGEIFSFVDTGILRVKADMTKFTLETLDKEKYSKRSELTGKGGKDINPTNELLEEVDKKLTEYLNAGNSKRGQ